MSLKRNVGFVALALFGIGDILGAGIYGLVGKAAGQMGQAVWLGFFVSMVVAGLTGLSYAAVGSRFPRAAGAAFVTQKAFSRTWLTYLVGLSSLASGLTSMATASRVFAGYMHGFFPAVSTNLLIICFAILLGLIVLKGIKESMWANSVCTLVEVSGLIIIIALGVQFIGDVNYLDTTTPSNPEGLLQPGIILSGAVLTFYSFIGFEDILNVSEEVKDPKRTIPKALLTAVVVSSVIYMLISLIAVSVLPVNALSDSKQPLVDVVKVINPNFPDYIFSVIALFAVSNTALLNFIMGSRLLYGMSRQGLLPNALSKVNRVTSTPHIAIAFVFVFLMVLALSGDISSLAKATSLLLLICFIMVNLSLFFIKRKEKKAPVGVFDVPIAIPILGAISCLIMIFHAKQPEIITASIILAVIMVFYFIQRPTVQDLEKMTSEED